MTENNIIYIGPPGTGKTYTALQEAEKCKEYRLIPFHPGYTYQDFIKGINVQTENDKMIYMSSDKIFLEYCKKADGDRESEYALILDDIQRADLSGVLGELMYAIEYRDQKITLSEGNVSVCVPSNLKIFATMSAAGSKGTIDYAMLRRFKVNYMYSSEEMLKTALKEKCVTDEQAIIEIYNEINDFIAKHKVVDDDKIKEYLLGYTYFLPEASKGAVTNVKRKIIYHIIPILEQYKKDGIIDFTNDEKYSIQKKYTVTYVTDYNEVDRDMSIEWCSQDGGKLGQAIKNGAEFEIRGSDGTLKFDEDGNIQKGICRNVYEFTVFFLNQYQQYIATELNENYYFDSFVFKNKFSYPELINTIVFFLLDLKLIDNTAFYNEIMRKIWYKGNGYTESLGKIQESKSDPEKYKCNILSTLYHDKNTAYIPRKPLRNTDFYSFFIINKKSKEYVVSVGANSTGKKQTGSKINIDLDLSDLSNTIKIESASNRYSDIIVIIHQFYKTFCDSVIEYKNNSNMLMTDNNDIIPYYDKIIQAFKNFFNLKNDYSDHKSKLPSDERSKSDNILKTIYFIEKIREFCAALHEVRQNHPTKGIYKVMDTANYFEVMNTLNIHQMILQGPPGTSKTYGAKEFIAKRIKEREEEGKEEKDKKPIEEYKNELANYQLKDNNSGRKVLWDIVQFHPSYSYEDFVRGIEVSTSEKHEVCYKTVNKILGRIADAAAAAKAANSSEPPEYYLIIDEINRANMATVFGELIYALEYRGQEVSTPYSVSNRNNIVIPDNLYIIGTMNTADKSIGGMDYAIRRRFLFFPVLPERNVVIENTAKLLGWDPEKAAPEEKEEYKKKAEKQLTVMLFDAVAGIFDKYLESDYHKDDVQIGHTYFLINEKKDNIQTLMYNRLKYQILPILREYYKDGILKADTGKYDKEKGFTSENIYYFAVHYDEFTDSKFNECYEAFEKLSAENDQ
ncbi:MAG: AAA family ATPase [Oscillospiraceae bacterium]|nr:AAA family ATPase [Oscillospiraceae bacterium]